MPSVLYYSFHLYAILSLFSYTSIALLVKDGPDIISRDTIIAYLISNSLMNCYNYMELLAYRGFRSIK